MEKKSRRFRAWYLCAPLNVCMVILMVFGVFPHEVMAKSLDFNHPVELRSETISYDNNNDNCGLTPTDSTINTMPTGENPTHSDADQASSNVTTSQPANTHSLPYHVTPSSKPTSSTSGNTISAKPHKTPLTMASENISENITVIVKPDMEKEIKSPSGKITLKIPRGAVSENVHVEMIERSPERSTGRRILGLVELNAIRISQKTLVSRFNKDIELSFQPTETQMKGLNPDTLKLYCFDNATKSWQPVTGSLTDTKKLKNTSKINHFSEYSWQADPLVSGPGRILNTQVNLNSGTVSYSYPVELPPGPGGFQPRLTLAYNSGTVDDMKDKRSTGSWVGIGWSLHPGRITHNLTTGGYFLDLNGISYRLVMTSSENNTTNGFYRTEPDCYYKIHKSDTTWEMQDREGNYYRFGGTSDSVQHITTTNCQYYRFDLSQFKDTNNNAANLNYMQFSVPNQAYTQIRSAYPEYLNYGNVQVHFLSSYTDNNTTDGNIRKDSPASYPLGSNPPTNSAPLIMETRQLDAIEVKVSGNLVRKYVFSYNTTDRQYSNDYGGIYYAGEHTLTSIRQVGADGSSKLPAITFTYASKQIYSKDTTRSEYSGNPGNPANFYRPYLVEIDSGYDGTVTYTYQQMPGTYALDTWTREIVVNRLIDSGSGPSENYTYTYTDGPQYALDRSLDAEYRGFPEVKETDAAGNYVNHYYYTTGSPDVDILKGREYKTRWYSSNSTLLREISDNYTIITTNVEPLGTHKKTYGGLSNPFGIAIAGDGCMYVADNANHRIVKYIGENMTGVATLSAPRGLLATDNNTLYAVESGNSRVVHMDTGGNIISTFGSGQLSSPSGIALSPDNYLYVADTGHDRIVKYDLSGNYINDFGTWSWVSGGHWQGWSEGFPPEVYVYWVTDYASDGLYDPYGVAVSPDNYVYVTDTGNNRIVKYTSNGDHVADFGTWSWVSGGHWQVYCDQNIPPNCSDPYWVEDYSSDGLSSPFGIMVSPDNYIYVADTGNSRILKYTSDGEYITNFGNWSWISGGHMEGYCDQQFPPNCYSGWVPNYYSDGLATPSSITISPNKYFYVADSAHNRIVQYAGNYASYAVQLQRHDQKIGNKTSRTSFVYDFYGNVVTQYNYGDTSTALDNSTVHYVYHPNTSNNILSKPARVRVYQGIHTSGTSTDNLTSESIYYYDGNNTVMDMIPVKGNLTRVEQKVSPTSSVSTYFTYDAYGNMLTQKDPRGNTITFAYDATHHTYPVMKTYPIAGIFENFTWDYGTGNKLSETGVNGQTTSYEYDTFKRMTKMIKPGDSSASPSFTYQYNNWGTIGQQNIKAIQKISDNQSLWQSVYFDGLGRIMQSQACGETGRTIISSTTTYNNRGLAEKQYVSQDLDSATVNGYKTPEAGWKYSVTAYDGLKRVTSVTKADGTTVSHDYTMPWQDLVTNEKGIKKRYYYDAFSNVVRIEELNASQQVYATTSYTYDVLNNLKQVKDNSNNTTSITYDWLSRKTAMTDPDMGSWSYGYDGNGNLTSQTDAKSQTITMAYDALNRLTGKSYPAGSGMTNITYTYDSTAEGNIGKGRRTGMADAAGATAYKYDARGRLITEKRTIDAVDYTTQFTYDCADRAATVTYPTGETVNNGYNGRGLPNTLSGSAAGTLVSSILYNQLGQMTEINLGNGIRTTYGYWGIGSAYDTAGGYYGKLWEIKTSKQPGGSPVLLDMKHFWDAGGNLSEREDVLAGQTEEFGYDFLDRLISVSGPYTESYTYDQIGNITSRNDTSYTYGAKPHAVTSVGESSYTYDDNGNMVNRNGGNIIWDMENRPISIADNETLPCINFTLNSFNFSAVIDGDNPGTQTLNISNSGSGTLNWTLSKTQSWLNLSTTSGTNTGNCTLSVNKGGLPTGTYNDNITITATGAYNTPQIVPVTLIVSGTNFLNGWNYRKAFTITGSTDGAQTNYAVPLRIYRTSGTDGTDSWKGLTVGKLYLGDYCNDYYADIRITKSDGITLLDYYIEYQDANSAVIWIKIDSIPASPSNFTGYIYYGNTSCGLGTNISNVALNGMCEPGSLQWMSAYYASGYAGKIISLADPPTELYGYTVKFNASTTVGDQGYMRKVDITLPGLNQVRVRNWYYVEATPLQYENHIVFASTVSGSWVGPYVFAYRSTSGSPTPTFRYYDGSTVIDSGYAPPTGQWVLFELDIDFTTGTYRVYIDGVKRTGATDPSFRAAMTNNATARIYGGGTLLSTGFSGTSKVHYYDNYAWRKYIPSEPTFSTWGNQEMNSISIPKINQSPVSFSFSGTQGGSNPAAKVLYISNSGGATLNWTLEKTQSWLTLSKTSGTNSDNCTLSVNIAGLPAGTYSDNITISSSEAGNAPQKVPVTLIVDAATSPTIGQMPASFNFSAAVEGANPTTQVLNITNSGVGTINWTLSKTQPWLSLSKTSGTDSDSCIMSVNKAGLSAGIYNDNITITAPGAINTPQVVPVMLIISNSLSDWNFRKLLTITGSNNGAQANYPVKLVIGESAGAVTSACSYIGKAEYVLENPYNDVYWANIDYAQGAPDNNSCFLYDELNLNQYTYILKGTSYGFNIPDSSVIKGIKVSVTRQCWSQGARDAVIQLTKNGVTRVGNNKANTSTNWQYDSWETVYYGGPSDMWGTMWTPAEINNSTFGIHLVSKAYTAWAQPVIDAIRIEVFYEPTHCGGLVTADFDDIRFTTSDGSTLCDYWIESLAGTTPNQVATIWVEVPSIAAYPSNTPIYMYFGNPSAPSVSSGANTFSFFDDFNNGSTIDETKWAIQDGAPANYPQSDGILQISPTENTYCYAYSLIGVPGWAAVRGRAKFVPTTNYWAAIGAEQDDWSYAQYFLCEDEQGIQASSYKYSNYPVNDYYVYETKFTAEGTKGASFFVNDIETGGSPREAEMLSVNTTYALIESDYITGGVGDDAWFDWVFIRKITPEEPVYSTCGSLETGLNTIQTISQSPASLNFIGTQGGSNPANQSLSITNAGGGTLSWTLAKTQNWLTLSKASGTNNDNSILSVNTSGLPIGTYSDNITITAPGATNSPQVIPVTFTVVSNSSWLNGWDYRKAVSVVGSIDGAQSNYQMKLLVGESSGATGEQVDCDSKIASDFDDLRFTASDGETLCDYWIESISGITPNQLATVWIKVPSIAAYPNNTVIFMYYGGTQAAVSSGANTFEYFDDFPGSSLGADWTTVGTASVSDSIVTVTGQTGADSSITMNTVFGQNHALRASLKFEHYNNTSVREMAGWRLNDHSIVIASHASAGICGTFYQYDGTAVTSSHVTGGISAGEFSVIDFIRNGSTSCIYRVDDASEVTITKNVPDENMGCRLIAGTLTSAKTYADWVLVRKYIANPPVWGTWGNEDIQNTVPTIWQSPASFDFTGTQDGANPDNQILHIANTGVGTLSWTLDKTQGWLTLSKTSGTDSDNSTLSVNTTGLSAGTYSDNITIVATGATNTPQVVPVTLTVNTTVPTIIHTPSSFSFNGIQGGGNPAPKVLNISNSGGGILNWTLVNTQSWLELSVASGNNTGSSILTINTSGLSAGIYTDNITITASGATNTPQVVPITLILSRPPTINHYPASFNFNVEEGGANPTTQILNISNSGAGTLNWMLTKTQSWLSLSATGGTNMSSSTLSVNTTGLSTGTYTDNITITAIGATNTPQVIPVTLTVGALPTISKSPSSFNFNATIEGANPDMQVLNISNCSGGTLSWALSKTQNWLNLSTTGGTNTGSCNLTVNKGGLPVGTYNDSITITANGATNTPQVIPVSLTISGTDFLSGWNYRKSVTVAGSSDGVQLNYQMKLNVYKGTGTDSGGTVYLNNHCSDNFTDLRFTKSDGISLLDYWIESYTSGNYAVVWVEVDSIPVSPNTATIYCYYGNSSALSTSNGDNTFMFFDHFDGAFPGTKWMGNTLGSSIDSSTLDAGSGVNIRSTSKSEGINVACRFKGKLGSGTVGLWDNNYSAYAQFASPNSLQTRTSYQSSSWGTSSYWNNDVEQIFDILLKGWTSARFFANGTELTGSPITNYVPNTTMGVRILSTGPNLTMDWILLRKYTLNEPVFSSWSNEQTKSVSNPIINKTPVSFSFNAIAGASNPAPQPLNISNSGTGTLNWTLSKTQGWLNLSSTSGTNSGSSTLTVNISGLSAGIYNDTVTISAVDANNTPQVVPVTLTLTNFLTGWQYRKAVSVTGSTDGAQTNYQMKLNVHKGEGTDSGDTVYLNNHCKDDFNDLRFTKSDGSTLLDYWIENYTSGTSAVVWVELDSVPANPGTAMFYCYYGNSGAGSASNGTNTFIKFDNFEWGSDGNSVIGSGGGITWALGAGECNISTEQKYSGIAADSRSLKMVAQGASTGSHCNFNLTPGSGYSIFSRFFKENSANTLIFAHGDGTYKADVRTTSSETIYAYPNSTSLGSFTANAWQTIELNNFDFTAHTYDIWLNGNKVKTSAAMSNESWANNEFRFFIWNSSVGNDAWCDNMFIRKWSAHEPTFTSWGNEQTNSLPNINRTPASFSFNAITGASNPAPQPLNISNSGTGTLNWTLSKTQGWLNLSSTSGTNSGSSTLTVNISGLSAGIYNDTVTISAVDANNTPQVVPVTLTLTNFLTGWQYRKAVSVTGSTDGAQTNYQMKLNVHKGEGTDSGDTVYLNNHCSDNFTDLRFTKSDGSTLLDYWIESYTSGTSAVVWVELDSVPANPGTAMFYCYYDNDEATSVSNGANTFVAFEVFEWGSDGDDLNDAGGSIDWYAWVGGSAKAEIDTAQHYHGTRSLLLYRDGSNSPIARFPHIAASNSYAIRFWARKDGNARFDFWHGDSSSRPHVKYESTEQLYYYNGSSGATAVSGQTITPDTWTQIEMKNIDFSGNTFDLYKNGSNIIDNYNHESSADGNSINQITFGVFGGTASTWIDDLIVRKWTASEPTFTSWGSEQSYAASIIRDEDTPALARAEDNAVKKYSTSREMVIPYKEARPVSYDPAPGTSTFVYDGDGRRVKKTEGGETILYINQYYEKNLTTGEVTTYYYSGGMRIAMRKGTTLEYMHQDHLTGTAVMSDASGAQVGTAMKYLPFGQTRSGSIPTDIKFTGQRLDSTGLYYFNARYYDPVIGRFISADTIVPGAYNPQALNRYSYCLNNPLKWIDPSGHMVGDYTIPTPEQLSTIPDMSPFAGLSGISGGDGKLPSGLNQTVYTDLLSHGYIGSNQGLVLDANGSFSIVSSPGNGFIATISTYHTGSNPRYETRKTDMYPVYVFNFSFFSRGYGAQGLLGSQVILPLSGHSATNVTIRATYDKHGVLGLFINCDTVENHTITSTRPNINGSSTGFTCEYWGQSPTTGHTLQGWSYSQQVNLSQPLMLTLNSGLQTTVIGYLALHGGGSYTFNLGEALRNAMK